MLTGDDLTVEQVIAVSLQLSGTDLAGLFRGHEVVKRPGRKDTRRGRTVYGISTGFGNFSDRLIDSDMRDKLQENLILSHAVGVGAPLSEEVVRGMLFASCKCPL